MGLFSKFRADPRTAFARRVLEKLNLPDAYIDRDDFAIRYKRDGDSEYAWIYLENTYQECYGSDEEYTAYKIDRLIQTVSDRASLPASWEDIRPLLRPVIRPATFGIGGPAGYSPLSRPWLPFLSEFVVIDTPASMAYVPAADPATWGVTPDEVFAIARSNLAAQTSPLELSPGALNRFADDGDAYFVSRLLLDGWLASLMDSPVAFIPSNNSLIIGSSSVADGLFSLAEEEYGSEPRSISPCAYTVDDTGAVIPYPATASSASKRAHLILANAEYGAQKHYLDKQHESAGTDIFVATYMAVGRPDGTMFSGTTWAHNVDSLIPEAEFVAFADTESLLFHVRWSVLAAHVPLVTAEGLYPPRYRVHEWPPPSTMDALRAAAVEL